MLFDDVMQRQVRAMHAFFADRSRSAMILRVDPDLELVAARFLALFGTRPDPPDAAPDDVDDAPVDPDAPGDEISFGASADFLEPRSFYIEAAAQIAETVGKLRDAYVSEGEELHLPDGLELARGFPSQPAIEALFAEYLEGVGRGLAGYHSTTAFVLRIDAMPDPRTAAISLARLGGYLVHPCVKLVVLDDRRAPRLPALRSVRTRYTASPYQPAASDVEGRITRFLASDDKRVLGLGIEERHLRHLWDLLSALPRRGVPIVPAYLEASFDDRTHFADLLYQRCATRKPPPPAWASRELARSGLLGETWEAPEGLPPDVYDMRATDFPESTLTELLELAVPGPATRCFVIKADVQRRADWPTFVRELAGAAVRLDARYLVLDVDGRAGVPEAPPEEYTWVEHEFVLDAQQMHGALELAVKRPDLPVPQRAQFLTLLAGLRTSQGRHPEAAELAAESIELSEQHGLAAETTAGWWTLGRALQRAGNLVYSRNAFSESTNAALANGSTLDAANGLMGVGHTYYLEQNWAQAIETYRVALEHWKNGGQAFGECQAWMWIGEAYRKARVFDLAENAFMTAMDIYQRMRAPFEDAARGGMAEVLERLAGMHRDAGRRALADECHARARAFGSHGPVPDRPS